MSEVIKYSLIYDYEFLDYLIENSKDILNKDKEKFYYVVKKCASIGPVCMRQELHVC